MVSIIDKCYLVCSLSLKMNLHVVTFCIDRIGTENHPTSVRNVYFLIYVHVSCHSPSTCLVVIGLVLCWCCFYGASLSHTARQLLRHKLPGNAYHQQLCDVMTNWDYRYFLYRYLLIMSLTQPLQLFYYILRDEGWKVTEQHILYV